MKNVIVTINGVLNTTQSRLDKVYLLPDKIIMLSKFIIDNKYSISLFNDDTRINKTEFKLYVDILPKLGLDKSLFKVFYNSSELANYVKINDTFVIVTSTPTLRNMNRVVFTNANVGLVKADLDKIKGFI